MAVKKPSYEEDTEVGELPKPLRISNIIVRVVYFWTIFGVITLSLRTVLLLFSANPATRFVTFIYETSDRYLAPFRGIFPSRNVGETGYLDVSAFFAIIIYLLFLWGIVTLIHYVEQKMAEAESEAEKQPRRVTRNGTEK